MNILTSNRECRISVPDTATVSEVGGIPKDEIATMVAEHFGNQLNNYWAWDVRFEYDNARVTLYKD